MIHFDSCALLKFIRPESESEALRARRAALPEGNELLPSALARLEITRTPHRAGVDPERIPYFAHRPPGAST
ncbi:hypothetical protein ABZ454_33605 [Streptomyces sp. NPDC005803]|uniref:hypothetical protein n=1 Tax=Streptomyces sp. NPDC005803 TaxID=3154297 RepID=UPI0033DEAE7E